MRVSISVNFLTSRISAGSVRSAITLVLEDERFHLNTNTHATTYTSYTAEPFFLGSFWAAPSWNLRGISELTIKKL